MCDCVSKLLFGHARSTFYSKTRGFAVQVFARRLTSGFSTSRRVLASRGHLVTKGRPHIDQQLPEFAGKTAGMAI
jgi:hypothetical protein